MERPTKIRKPPSDHAVDASLATVGRALCTTLGGSRPTLSLKLSPEEREAMINELRKHMETQ